VKEPPVVEVHFDFYSVSVAKKSRAANRIDIYAVVRVNRVRIDVNDVTRSI